MTTEKNEFTFPDEQEVETKAPEVKEQELEIEVVDDTPPEDRNRKPMMEPPSEPTDEELAGYSESVRKRFQHFTKGFHEERRAKETAARERDEAVRIAQAVVAENQRLQGSLSQNQQALLEQAKKTVSTDIEAAKRKYKEAMEAFDTDGTIAAQQELTAAQMRAERINNFRPPPVQAPPAMVQPQPQAQRPPAVDPKTASWQEQNKWFGNNRKMTAYALSLHTDLVESGISVASDEYYNRINSDMRSRFPEEFSDSGAGATSPRKVSNVVASATRSTAPRKIVLSKTQVDIAKRLGVPLELYARKVAEEMRN